MLRARNGRELERQQTRRHFLQREPYMKPWKELTPAEKLGVYLFAAVVGQLGGFVFNIVNLYLHMGWNATWIHLAA